jgi:hypothetical protein
MGHHDLLFRDTFQRPRAARWLIARAHPELSHLEITRVDPVTVSSDRGERRTDLLFHLGGAFAVRVAVQHQSAPDAEMDLRILEESAAILRSLAKERAALPALMTLVAYHGAAAWTTPLCVSDRVLVPQHLAHLIPRARYRLIQLHELGPDELGGAPSVAALAVRLLAAHASRPAPGALWTILREQASLLRDVRERDGTGAIRSVVSYVIQQDSVIPEPDLLAALYEAEPHLEEVMASCADQWEARGLERGIVIGMERGLEQGREQGLERGLERGLEQGLERGHREATSASLVRLGTRLLGAPPAEVQRRLQAADVAALERALDAVLDATSWDQLFAR